MTARWPGGCQYALHLATNSTRPAGYRRIAISSQISHRRHYAQQQQARPKHAAADGVTATPADPVKSALTIIESNARVDPINPPRSTIPPPLSLPARGDEAAYLYWYRLGRAYGTFYKDGIKAVWFNWKASKLLRERIQKDTGIKNTKEAIDAAVEKRLITRSEFQLLARNDHDIKKLPVFSLMVVVFGEWLVFIVPFVPNRVPGTCRIPKQVTQMREKAEIRRRISFRQGITEPSREQLADHINEDAAKGADANKTAWPVAFSSEHRTAMLKNLREDQLLHLSSTLGLHNNLWDRIQLPPPAFLLRRLINSKLQSVTQDDYLILQNGGQSGGQNNGISRLTSEELYSACEERGIDILGKKDEALRGSLSWWLKMQQEDGGNGKALFTMLFRRPNAWDSSVGGEKKRM